jgi:putative ubiquitin-RnfH superfamily antitoxin RatB of RatAB toxin-antitoxin module
MDSRLIDVELAYATPAEQVILPVRVPRGATLQQAIEISGVLRKYPEIDLGTNKVGVFGKLAKLDTELREKDRVEIYRPLIADPKAVRKMRAEEGKEMRKGAGARAREATSDGVGGEP